MSETNYLEDTIPSKAPLIPSQNVNQITKCKCKSDNSYQMAMATSSE